MAIAAIYRMEESPWPDAPGRVYKAECDHPVLPGTLTAYGESPEEAKDELSVQRDDALKAHQESELRERLRETAELIEEVEL